MLCAYAAMQWLQNALGKEQIKDTHYAAAFDTQCEIYT